MEAIGFLPLALGILGFSLCLLSYLLRLAAHISSFKGGRSAIGFRALLIVTFLGYFGWGYWSGADPVKMNIPTPISLPVGVILAAAGLGLFLYSEIVKHGVGDASQLYTRGIYARIRHPMYLGLILLHIGFPLIAKSFLALLSTVLWGGIIAAWTHFEEKNLERHFGQRYRDYKRRTWF